MAALHPPGTPFLRPTERFGCRATTSANGAAVPDTARMDCLEALIAAMPKPRWRIGEYAGRPDECPDDHGPGVRGPIGPCEDLGQCLTCWSPIPRMRPPGETFGWHADDCSLPERHWGECVGGGSGHPTGHIRG